MENTAGQFFFQPETGRNNRSIQRFCYKKIVRKTDGKSLAQVETDFPIYVVISAETVSFRCSAQHNSNIDGKPYPAHYGTGHIQDFSFALNYTDDITEWLSSQRELGAQLLDPEIYIRISNPNEINYSSLKQWQSNIAQGGILLTQRELVLDFLFDLFHSNVFNSFLHIQKLKAALLSNPLGQAIITKGKFYFYQEELSKASHSFISKTTAWFKKKSKAQKQRNYSKKERSWLKNQVKNHAQAWLILLRKQESLKLISPDLDHEAQWFEDVELEHKKVYSKLSVFRLNITLPPEESELSAQWLLSRYNLFGAMRRQFIGITFILQRILQFGIFFWLFFIIWKYSNSSIEIDLFDPYAFPTYYLICKWLLVPWLIILVIVLWVLSATIERAISLIVFLVAFLINSSIKTISLLIEILSTQKTILGPKREYIKKAIIFHLTLKKPFFKWPRKGGVGATFISVANILQSLMPKTIFVSMLVWGWLIDEGRLNKIEDMIKNMTVDDVDSLIFSIVCLYLALGLIFIFSRLSLLFHMKSQFCKVFKMTRRALFLLFMGFIYSFLIGVTYTLLFSTASVIASKSDAILRFGIPFVEYKFPLNFTLLTCSLGCAFIGILIEMSTQNSFASLFREKQ